MRICLAVLILTALPFATPARGEGETVLTDITTGEFWYGMYDAEGEPQGYCRLVVGEREGGGFTVEWELKLAFPGGSYEEERTMAVDAEYRLVSLSYTAGDELVAEARRDGAKLVGKFRKDGELQEVAVDVPEDAGSSMLWVLVGAVPPEPEGSLERTEINEASGFEVEGKTTIRFVGGSDTIVTDHVFPEPVWNYEMLRTNGSKLPLAVDARRRIVWADWGGSNVMRLSEEPTKHLFAPKPPAVAVVESPADRLVVRGTFPRFTAAELYDHFTRPELLAKWWPPEAVVELEEGGAYRLVWPDQWELDGKVLAFDPGKRFVFSWLWKAQADGGTPRRVEALFADSEEGAVLTITHSPYDESPADTKAKEGHRQGWEMFLTRLHGLRD